jgi:hypothetical protein
MLAGRVVAEYDRGEATRAEIGRSMTGAQGQA